MISLPRHMSLSHSIAQKYLVPGKYGHFAHGLSSVERTQVQESRPTQRATLSVFILLLVREVEDFST